MSDHQFPPDHPHHEVEQQSKQSIPGWLIPLCVGLAIATIMLTSIMANNAAHSLDNEMPSYVDRSTPYDPL